MAIRVKKILELIPDELLEELAIEMNVNYQTKKLT
jgi:hypothetical protein